MSVKVKKVVPVKNMVLSVTFDNDVTKLYDVNQLIEEFPIYKELIDNDILFNQVEVDCGGYAIAWNSSIDISETELWENGELVEPQSKRANVHFNKNGQGRTGTKVTLPLSWVQSLGISEENKEIDIKFDGSKITIEKPLKTDQVG